MVRQNADFILVLLAATQGKLAEALQRSRSAREAGTGLGDRSAPLQAALDSAEFEIWFRGNKERGRALLQRAVASHPLDSIPAAERPHNRLIWMYSLLGDPAAARSVLNAFDRRRAQEPLLNDERDRHVLAGHIAVAERRYDEALAEYRADDQGSCAVCPLPNIARPHDLAGNADSAIVNFERFLAGPYDPIQWLIEASAVRAGAHKRLGELYEAKGDRTKAMTHYAQFIELWKDADPDLQPLVRQARDRLAALQRAER